MDDDNRLLTGARDWPVWAKALLAGIGVAAIGLFALSDWLGQRMRRRK